jgi:uridylate kinase
MFKKILFKISGEALAGTLGHGLDDSVLERIASEIKEVHDLGVEISIVVGGGNIFRGMKVAADKKIPRSTADYMGMLATVQNALALQAYLECIGVTTRVMTALNIDAVAEPFIERKALAHLKKGIVVIFAGGTGSPHFTTDTAAALRATQIGAEAILKATKVDGVYDKDPNQYPDATRLENISYAEVISKNLQVLDLTAITHAANNNIQIIVFNMEVAGNIVKAVKGECLVSTIRNN